VYYTYDDVASGEAVSRGGDFHPSPAGALYRARRLAMFIAAKKGWAPPQYGSIGGVFCCATPEMPVGPARPRPPKKRVVVLRQVGEISASLYE
jgi:hypothetical protein